VPSDRDRNSGAGGTDASSDATGQLGVASEIVAVDEGAGSASPKRDSPVA